MGLCGAFIVDCSRNIIPVGSYTEEQNNIYIYIYIIIYKIIYIIIYITGHVYNQGMRCV